MTANRAVLAVRVTAALVQAGALYVLLEAAMPPMHWPGTQPVWFLPLALVAAGTPLLVILGAGRLPGRALAGWAVVAAAFLAGFGWWDVARRAASPLDATEALLPWLPLALALVSGFFVANVLVTDTVLERRWMPPYTRHIDTAWKQALQAVFAVIFVGLFWSVLELGAGLFQTLNIDLIGRVVQHPWFFIPATTLAVAVAIHATDVQPGLIRGARAVALLLLSWLLPLLAGIVLAFLAALPFTSLQPLWQTHFAAAALLSAAGWLVVLMNAAYGDGNAWSGSRVKRLAAWVGSVELLPLMGLAAAALDLRVTQYGWSVDRIFAAAGGAVLALYAAGYVAAALTRRARILERTNLVAAHLSLVVVLLLFSPAADPARLMVANQVARLRAGAVALTAFDFAALDSDGARWGAVAVARLRADPDATIATAARNPGNGSYNHGADGVTVLEPDQLAGRVIVLPAGRTLPPSLLHANFGTDPNGTPLCFRPGVAVCTVRFLALVPGAPDRILMLNGYSTDVFEHDTLDHWRMAGSLTGPVECDTVQKGLQGSDVELVPHPAQDLLVGGARLTLVPLPQDCPSDAQH